MGYNYVHFEPWIGDDYWNDGGRFGKKILILGESHYGDDEGSSMTNNIIYDQANSNWVRNPYTKFEKALVGYNTDEDDRKSIWDSVAFYNYIQETLDDPDDKPQQYQWDDGEDPFFEVLEELNPDVVLVWGRRLWNNMTSENYNSYGTIEWDGKEYGYGYFELNDGTEIPIWEVKHPGRAYEFESWNSFLNNYVF